jgi:hypothetical protein
MKVLLRLHIYALWDEKSTRGSSTYRPVRLRGPHVDFSSQSTYLHSLATDLHE